MSERPEIEKDSGKETSIKQINEKQQKEELKQSQNLFKLRTNDIGWRLQNRPIYGKFFIELLKWQNMIVFGILVLAFLFGILDKIGYILSIIIAGTLVETMITARIIVRWLFSDIDYTIKKEQ